jgi:hypothetical protein
MSAVQKQNMIRYPANREALIARTHSEESKAKVKAAHREKNRIYPAFGKLWCLKELAEAYNVKYAMLKDRVRAGWNPEIAVLTPKRKGGL